MRATVRNHVAVTGRADGTPMIFAHGFGCDQAMWRNVAPWFADDHQVIVFDHVGFGGSDLSAWDPVRHATLAAYAEDMLDFVAELDLHDIVFVGHSVAAMIGVLAAVRAPERFAHLVLVAPSPRYLDDPLTGYRGGFTDADIAELLAALDRNYLGWSSVIAPRLMGNPDRPALGQELTESFCRTDPRVASLFARATFLSDNRADLPAVAIATLILQCSDDPIAGGEVGAYVHDHIAGSELVQLAATGHCPNVSAPEETVAAIRDYLHRREHRGG